MQSLSADEASAPLIRLQLQKTGLSHTSCNIWWAYAESLRDYSTFGVVPGISRDWKDLATRFDLSLFAITGQTNAGRVHVFAMEFLHAENQKSVEWFLRCFKDAVQVWENIISMHASFSILTTACGISLA